MPLRALKRWWVLGLDVKTELPDAKALRDVGGYLALGTSFRAGAAARVHYSQPQIGRYPWRVSLPSAAVLEGDWHEVAEHATYREALAEAKRFARLGARARTERGEWRAWT